MKAPPSGGWADGDEYVENGLTSLDSHAVSRKCALMGLMYYPRVGEILVCHYDLTAIGSEMIKSRPVVVIGPRLRRRADLVGVIPFSTTDPNPAQDYHCLIELDKALPKPFDSPTMWAKCDMYGAVSIQRLDRFKEPRQRHGGARQWTSAFLNEDQIEQVRAAWARALGFSRP